MMSCLDLGSAWGWNASDSEHEHEQERDKDGSKSATFFSSTLPAIRNSQGLRPLVLAVAESGKSCLARTCLS